MSGRTVSQLIADLQGPESDSAACALEGLGRAAVPALCLAFAHATLPGVLRLIVEVIDQSRSPEDLAFFAEALKDSDEIVWQAAIDALASQPCRESLEYLRLALEREAASTSSRGRKLSFLKEAVAELQGPNPFGVGKGGAGHA